MPLIFLLLPLPWLLGRFCWVQSSAQRSNALLVPFFQTVKSVVVADGRVARRSGIEHLLLWLLWLALLIAAAGPQWLGPAVSVPQAGRDIMLALDLSNSMQLTDMSQNGQPVDRLTLVKGVAKQFVSQRKGDRLGLIVYGSKAYLYTPLTFDRKTIAANLADASIGLAGGLTAIGDAIGLAVKRLQNSKAKQRVLILLSDGVANSGVLSPLAAAKLAKKANIKIYTVGLGAERFIVDGFLGQQWVDPSRDLDESTLKTIAKWTDGRYFRAKDQAGLQAIYRAIDSLEPTQSDEQLLRPQHQLYPWPLALALLCSLGLCRKRLFKWRNAYAA